MDTSNGDQKNAAAPAAFWKHIKFICILRKLEYLQNRFVFFHWELKEPLGAASGVVVSVDQ